MPIRMTRSAATALALTLGLSLAACAGPTENRTLDSVHQPVVQRSNFQLDLTASSGGGLPISEQRRLSAWFEAMDVRYGDRISIEDPLSNVATRDGVSAIAGRHGLLVSDTAPTTAGLIEPGKVRVVITRSTASVPSCPNWDDTSAHNFSNATSNNFGCAVNSNLAAMVADPEHLVQGAKGNGETLIMTSNKAIETYRNKAPTGAGALTQNATGGGN